MHVVIPYVIAAVLFGIGTYGVLVRRNAVLVLMAVELMLSAVNVVLVTADLAVDPLRRTGGSFALFIIVLAAAEIGVALAVVLQLYRTRQTVAVDDIETDPLDTDTETDSDAETDTADLAAAGRAHR
jgi:NADH-quinone oxidoreductase subunit K